MGALADANQQAMPADNELRVGTVAQLTNPDTGTADGVYCWFTADRTVKPQRCFSVVDYCPVVGDAVQVLRQDQGWLILGLAWPRGAIGRWTNLASIGYNSPWADVGGAAALGRVRLGMDGFVQFAGAVKTTAGISSGSVMCTLPAIFRPAHDEMVSATFDGGSLGSSQVAARVTIQQAGTVVLTSFSGPVTAAAMGLGHWRFPSAALT